MYIYLLDFKCLLTLKQSRIPSGMANLKIMYFSPTKGLKENTALYKSTLKFNSMNIVFKENNKEPLSKIYNQALIHSYASDHDVLVILHDDIWLDYDPSEKICNLMNDYDLIGVAGASKVAIKYPSLWHLMGGGFGSGHLHGAVAHGDNNQKSMTYFGVYPHRVVMIDGVFMAMNRNITKNMCFDETNPYGFHHYDLDFSYECFKKGYKVGVGDIIITHESPGLREIDQNWKNSSEWFLNKHTN